MAEFIKNGDGWIAGKFYRDGAHVHVSAAQAKYLADPLGDDLLALDDEAQAAVDEIIAADVADAADEDDADA